MNMRVNCCTINGLNARVITTYGWAALGPARGMEKAQHVARWPLLIRREKTFRLFAHALIV
jgi:hypothetical protein